MIVLLIALLVLFAIFGGLYLSPFVWLVLLGVLLVLALDRRGSGV